MVIERAEIPADSLVRKYLPADYTDAFGCETEVTKSLTADDVMVGIWTRQTGWVAALFRLRHFLVRFVGLQGDEEGDPAGFEKVIRESGTNRFASVPAKNDRETVLLLTDKHLDAWMSVYVADGGDAEEEGEDYDKGEGARKTVFAITVVKFHNRLGRVYFFIIRPFHSLVVKSMLRKSVDGVIAVK